MAASLAEVKAVKLAELKRLRLEFERRERERLASVDVFGMLGYVPTPKQAEFHAATEFSVLFGGSAGGGKSRALTAEAIRACVRHPGIRVGAFRRTYPELKESLIAELAAMEFGGALGAVWNGSDFELRFPNGSLLMFRYAETLTDATRRQGGQYQLLVFDERTLTPADVIAFLESRLRSGRADIPVLGVRSSANPGGASHGDVKKQFITATNYGEKIVLDSRGRTVRFIRSRLSDNPHINPEYAADLRALPEKLQQAFLEGNWDVFAGAMFPELSRDRHIVEPFTLPATWQRYCGIDWGYSPSAWATIWAAVDEQGRVYAYREAYAREVGEEDQARRILAAEEPGESISVRFADDAMWATRGAVKSIAEAYAGEGVYLTQAGKGPGSRVIGWQRIHSYLGESAACAYHRSRGLETCPRLHVFPQCENLFRELADLPHASKGDPEDSDQGASDHACLAAGTLVETARGAVPIERIVAGDWVWTREGLRPVIAAGLTARAAATGTVLLSDGTTLHGTGNHPVWVAGHGWKRLDALRYADILSAWPEARASSIGESPSAVTQTPGTGLTGCTSLPEEATVSAASAGFTRKSGRMLTGRFPRAITSITRTRIRSTTTPQTWNAFRVKTITRTTSPSATSTPRNAWRTWTQSGPSLPSGTGQRPGWHGTASTASAPGKGARARRIRANSAAASSSRALATATTGFAPTIAARNGGGSLASTTRTGCVPAAAGRSRSTSTRERSAAPVSVRGPFASDSEPHNVYNLTVDGAHEFYANGVLVHNCDALRYLLINLGTGPDWTILDEEKPSEIAEALGPYQPMGVFAYRPMADEPVWFADDEDVARRTVRTAE